MIEKPVFNLKAIGVMILTLYLGGIFLFLLYLVLALFRPFEQYDLQPTYEELERRGYYAYVVPPSIVEQYGWQEETFIWSWSRHCNADSHSRSNPLRITYFDKRDERVFRIELSPWGLIEWAPFQPTVAIPFD